LSKELWQSLKKLIKLSEKERLILILMVVLIVMAYIILGLGQANAELRSELKELKDEIHSLKQKVTSYEELTKSLSSDISIVNSEIEDIKGVIQNLFKKYETLVNLPLEDLQRLENLSFELSEALNDMKALENKVEMFLAVMTFKEQLSGLGDLFVEIIVDQAFDYVAKNISLALRYMLEGVKDIISDTVRAEFPKITWHKDYIVRVSDDIFFLRMSGSIPVALANIKIPYLKIHVIVEGKVNIQTEQIADVKIVSVSVEI